MIRHEYETVYVTRSDLTEEDTTKIDDKLQGIIASYGGDMLVFESWGRRKLAYPIRRQLHGTYKYMHFLAPADLPIELERNMRLEDSLIRFLTVRLAENVVGDVEELRTLAAQAQERRTGRLGLYASDEEERDDDDASNTHDSNTEN